MRLMMLAACAAIGLVIAWPVTAQPENAVVPVPNQSWYPEGYLDLRIAAAKQVADFPRDPLHVLAEDWNDPRLSTYDLIDCNLGSDLPDDLDNRTFLMSELALDVARMRSEFASLGYRPEVYDEPLLNHERAMLQAIASANPSSSLPQLVTEDGISYSSTPDDWLFLSDIQSDYDLLDALESRRKRLQRRQPEFIVEGGCGAGEEEFEIRLVPANGELWLINAFAFRVCERKVADPWNRRACSWTQFVAGDTTFASGRYMYEARWPNGTVKRGARVLQPDYNSDDPGSVLFRRD